MSSVDDILNAQDSDEDTSSNIDANAIDIELLLTSKDDDQDYVDAEPHLNGIHDTIESGLVEATVSPTETNSQCGDDFSTQILDGGPGNVTHHQLSSLHKAEQRELRFLSLGGRETMSALQIKRKSSVLVYHSHIKFEEMTVLSAQLSKNSNHHQHGPGTATCIAMNADVIAIGTVRGLIIIFDQSQEIRQVLGSKIPNQVRPTSAVTSLCVVNLGSTTILVCGHDSGTICLWDLITGIILKLITDLHSAPVVVSSIVAPLNEGMEKYRTLNGFKNSSLSQISESWKDGASDYASSLTAAAVSSFQGTSVTIVTADASGVMYRTRFSKTLWSSAYSSESDCLLDESSGQLQGFAALPPLSASLDVASRQQQFRGSAAAGVPVGGGEHGEGVERSSVGSQQQRQEPPRSVPSSSSSIFTVVQPTSQILSINLSSYTWIIQIQPSVKVLYKWSAPTLAKVSRVSESSGGKNERTATPTATSHAHYSPTLDWCWINYDQVYDESSSSSRSSTGQIDVQSTGWMPSLARGLGCVVQILNLHKCEVAADNHNHTNKANKYENEISGSGNVKTGSSFAFLASSGSISNSRNIFDLSNSNVQERSGISNSNIGKSDELQFFVRDEIFRSDEEILSVRWVNSSSLAILTTGCIVLTTPTLVEVERYSLSPSNVKSMKIDCGDGRVNEIFPQLHNHPASGRHTFYLWTGNSVAGVRVQSCFDLTNQLISKGHWLEALALVLESIQKYPSFNSTHSGAIDKYIVRYATLAVKQIVPSASVSSLSTSASVQQSKNHFHLVSGVCIEYCVCSSRLELLFTDVYGIFKSAGQHGMFLSSLEPFILSRTIRSLPPLIIADFFESAVQTNQLPSIERCVAFFDVENIDMNFVTRFLYERRMYSSFLYVYANGLGDFAGAFQLVFQFLFHASKDAVLRDPEKSDLGFKLILFLSYTFRRKLFPRGDASDNISDVHVWRLLKVVTGIDYQSPPSFMKPLASSPDLQRQSSSLETYPYLSELCNVDADSTMNVLFDGIKSMNDYLVSSDSSGVSHTFFKASDQLEFVDESNVSLYFAPTHVRAHLSQIFENILAFCVQVDSQNVHGKDHMVLQFFDNFLELVSISTVQLSHRFLDSLVKFANSRSDDQRRWYEECFLNVAENQKVYHAHDMVQLKRLFEGSNFWLTAFSLSDEASSVAEAEAQIQKALQFYQSIATEERFSHCRKDALVFTYVDVLFRKCKNWKNSDFVSMLEEEVINRLPQLSEIELDNARAIVRNFLSRCVPKIIERTMVDPKVQFEALDALIVGSDIPNLVSGTEPCFSAKSLLVYFQLLCTFDPSRTVNFLRKFGNHIPTEECLHICKQSGLSEAVSILMEKNGSIQDALEILLRDLSVKLKSVRRDVDGMLRAEMSAHAAACKSSSRQHSVRQPLPASPLLSTTAIAGAGAGIGSRGEQAIDIPTTFRAQHSLAELPVSYVLSLHGLERAEAAKLLPPYKMLETVTLAVADMCSRNSTSAAADGSKLSQEGEEDPTRMWLSAFDFLLLERQTIRTGTMSSSGEITVVFIGLMLQILMQKMNGSIAAQDIVRRVTSKGNAAGIRLGEFKDMMLNMLGSHGQDLSLYQVINSLIRNDLAGQHRRKVLSMSRGRCHVSTGTGANNAEHGGNPDNQTLEDTVQATQEQRIEAVVEESDRTKQFLASQRIRYLLRKSCDNNAQQQWNDSQLLSPSIVTASSGSLHFVPSAPLFSLLPSRAVEVEQRKPGTIDRNALYVSQLHFG